MTFYPIRSVILENVSPEDFRCITETVSTERLVEVDRIATDRLGVLTEILGELAWSFWQSLGGFPRNRPNAYAR
jgi:hypothetical protein